jgi:HK97 family phage portal protein
VGLFWPRAQQQRDFFGITGAQDLVPTRSLGSARKVGSQVVTDDRAMRNSVVWACLKLRAGLISTFPVKQYRDVLGIQTEWPYMPPILTDPGGVKVGIIDWMAMTQLDLDRSGNTVGLIVERSPAKNKYYPEGLPSRIELQPAAACSYIERRNKPDVWRIGGVMYDPRDVYHEATNRVAGLKVGLPTVLYAALAIGESLSMQQYGLDWFGNGGVPKARMRNIAKRLGPDEISTAKQWYADTINNGDVLVTGNDWEYDFLQSQTAGSEFIEGRKMAGADICRFLNTPADLVDVQASSGGSITYANIGQKNTQYLIMNLGPDTVNRQDSLTRLLPQPRYVLLDTDALLRMDPQTLQDVLRSKIEGRQMTNAEARAVDNRKPLTKSDKDEFIEIYGLPKPRSQPVVNLDPSGSVDPAGLPPAPAPTTTPAPAPATAP